MTHARHIHCVEQAGKYCKYPGAVLWQAQLLLIDVNANPQLDADHFLLQTADSQYKYISDSFVF
jgi:hypothetical protein